jgi:hypothetical protein
MDEQKSPQPQPHGDNYRSIARKLRKLALECRSPKAHQEILDLAARMSVGAIISISVRRIETQPPSKEGMPL